MIFFLNQKRASIGNFCVLCVCHPRKENSIVSAATGWWCTQKNSKSTTIICKSVLFFTRWQSKQFKSIWCVHVCCCTVAVHKHNTSHKKKEYSFKGSNILPGSFMSKSTRNLISDFSSDIEKEISSRFWLGEAFWLLCLFSLSLSWRAPLLVRCIK